jgi:serine/threonine-protein kinase OSR1/STK39
MAPEVMEQSNGYDQQADIWCVLAPFLLAILSRSMQVAGHHALGARARPRALRQVPAHESAHDDAAKPSADGEFHRRAVVLARLSRPSQLEADSGAHHFSRHLRDLVAQCLQKDPKKRPSAKSLLDHRFFQEKAKKPDFLMKTLLEGLPSLGERVRLLRERENVKRGQPLDSDIKSQSQYVRGVSNWNFNIEDLKGSTEGESPLAGAASDDGKVQHRGRFDVYSTAVPEEKAEGEAADGADQTVKATRKGRFAVEELREALPLQEDESGRRAV